MIPATVYFRIGDCACSDLYADNLSSRPGQQYGYGARTAIKIQHGFRAAQACKGLNRIIQLGRTGRIGLKK